MIQSRQIVSIGARMVVALAAGVFACAFVIAGSAQAQQSSVWWGLTQSARPSDIQPGTAENEVQRLTVTATGGDVMAIEPISYEKYENGEGAPKLALFQYDASHEEVQMALESIYGNGNVEVAGGPGDALGSEAYTVTFTGGLAGRPLPLINTEFSGFASFYGGTNLTGTATVTEQTNGRPDGTVVMTAENIGYGDANGATDPITMSDELPSGLKVTTVEMIPGVVVGDYRGGSGPTSCSEEAGGEARVACTFEGTLHAYETIEMRIGVVAQGGAASTEANHASVTGGQGTEIVRARPLQIGGEASFGLEEALLTAEEAGGAPDVQAGSHPFQLTSVVTFNENREAQPIALPKNISVLAAQGLVGNPTPFSQCTDLQFSKLVSAEYNECPVSSMIGVAVITYNEPSTEHLKTTIAPIFNMVPNAGEPARFGFYARIVPVFLDTSIRTGEDYGVTVSSDNTVQVAGVVSSKIILWGVPGDPRHDAQRGWGCLEQKGTCGEEGGSPQTSPSPFLMLPTSCAGPLKTRVQVSSWTDRSDVLTYGMSEASPAMDGCNHLPFAPEVAVAPDVSDGSTPTGLTVDVHVPQTAALNPQGLAESTLRDTTVTLPEGVSINPGGADGLEACSETETGFLGKEAGEPALNLFTPALPEPFCPATAKIGTVVIHSPLLPNPLEGAVYLASPAPAGEAGQNPFDSLVAMYMIAEDPISGTLVKLPGEVVPNPVTGQLVSTFEDTPQLPFEELELHFFGGSRAPLATPAACGAYTTQASFTPWSGSATVRSASTFQITSGPNGSPCANPQPFHPAFQAGTTNIQAGAFTPLTTTMGHPDGSQVLGGLKMKLPPGLLGSLAKVKLCEEPQAAEGTCGSESLIGHTVVTAGLGSTPAVVKRPGNVYITGPYKGAPYGLSIVNPAEAGPFDLEKGTPCDCVVVRAKIEVDPHTAQLTITSDPLPTIIKGIPLLLQHVNVSVERPEFTFNPTNCSAMKIEGSMQSSEGASVPISMPFQVANCASLPFKPGFKAATKSKHSRKDGAKLEVLVTSSAGHANIAKAHVELPKKLPSRLSTLQKACTEAQFEANPAGCPAASDVGSVVVHTPVLPVPLTGPAYFVSHGGAKFPELVMVLQGYGITVDLAGETFISKKGITSTTLNAVPDVPFDSFKLTLPEGPHSALAANGSLCGKPLLMRVQLTGQNGEKVAQRTKVKVDGCAATRKKQAHGQRSRHKGRHYKTHG